MMDMKMENKKEHFSEHDFSGNFSESEGGKSKALTYTLVALIVSLLLFSAVQTFQIGSLEKIVFSGVSGAAISSGISGVSPAAAPSAAAGGSAGMVGGC